MTQIAAISEALLRGEVLTIMDGFKRFSCSNLPRELSRSIEQKFGVEISKVKKDFKSRYDSKPGYYYQYRLNTTEQNADGRQKMIDYVIKNGGKIQITPAKTALSESLNDRLF
jgi:hypothetical protein